jgi:hypothetical protein
VTTSTTVPAGTTCGDASDDRQITASDALVALKTAVGSADCDPCVCDINGSSGITASDALVILETAVGIGIDLACPA